MSNSLGVCGSYGPWDLLQGLTLPSVAPNTASGMVRAVQYLDLCSTEIRVVPEACTRQQKVVVSYVSDTEASFASGDLRLWEGR